MSDHGDLVAEFCGVTGAAPDVAEAFLSAHDWNIERSLDTYFRDETAVPQVQEVAGAGVGPAGVAGGGPGPAVDEDAIEILEDDEAGGQGLADLARQRASALAARQQAEQEQEDPSSSMLALQGSRLSARLQPPPESHALPEAMDLGDDDLQAVAAAIAAADGAGADADLASFHRRQQQELLAMYQRQAAQQDAAAAVQPPAEAAYPFETDDLGEPAAAAGAGAGAGAGPSGAAADHDVPLDLPEGINIEEARMLEAAMLGIPYAGRIPDFSTAAAAAAAPLPPGALEQRSLRQEQDAAYEESLALDRAKQESLDAAAAEAEAAERAQQEAEQAAEAAAARAAAALQELLASKRARLPAEPSDGDGSSLQIVVRLPTGSRKGRRFRPTDPLQAVFDFVDVECAEAAASEQDSAGCGIKPGSYRLVTQFPRKVLVEGSSSSLQDAGISSDTAMFLEPL